MSRKTDTWLSALALVLILALAVAANLAYQLERDNRALRAELARSQPALDHATSLEAATPDAPGTGNNARLQKMAVRLRQLELTLQEKEDELRRMRELDRYAARKPRPDNRSGKARQSPTKTGRMAPSATHPAARTPAHVRPVDPRVVALRRKRLTALQQRMQTAAGSQLEFIDGLDVSLMTDRQRANHDELREVLGQVGDKLATIEKAGSPRKAERLSKKLKAQRRYIGELMQHERQTAIIEMGRQLGFADNESAQLADYVRYVELMTNSGILSGNADLKDFLPKRWQTPPR